MLCKEGPPCITVVIILFCVATDSVNLFSQKIVYHTLIYHTPKVRITFKINKYNHIVESSQPESSFSMHFTSMINLNTIFIRHITMEMLIAIFFIAQWSSNNYIWWCHQYNYSSIGIISRQTKLGLQVPFWSLSCSVWGEAGRIELRV